RLTGAYLFLSCLATAQQTPQPSARAPVDARYEVLAARLVGGGDDAAEDSRELVLALNQAGDAYALKHDYTPARRAYGIACSMAGRIGATRGEFFCRVGAANCSLGEAHYDEALAAYEPLRRAAEAHQDHAALARVLHGIGLVHRARSEHAEAQVLY